MNSPELVTSGHREDEGTITFYNAEGLASVQSQVRKHLFPSNHGDTTSNLYRKRNASEAGQRQKQEEYV